MVKNIISTPHAPAAIGPYSQAVKVNNLVFLSGQIPIDPTTGEFVEGGIEAQIEQVFKNLTAVAKAAGGSIQDIIKLSVFLTDLGHFSLLNASMERHFSAPYPARTAIEISALPKGALVEMDAIIEIDSDD